MARLAALPSQEMRVVGLISFGHMLSHFYFLVLPPILPLLQKEFHVSYALLSLPMATFAIAAGIVQTPVGFLVDRMGARKLLVAGLMVQGLSIAAIGLTGSFWQLLVLYTVTGIANTVFHPADYSILSASVARERLGRAFSVHLFSGNFGWVLTPPVMGGLTYLWNWRVAFLVVGAVGAAYAFYVWSRLDRLEEEIAARPGADEKKQGDGGVGAGLKILSSFPVLMCLVFFIMMSIGFTGVRSFLVVAFDQMYAMPIVTANTILTGFTAGSAGGVLLGGIVADRYGPRLATAIGTLVSAAVMLAVVGSYNLPVSALMVLITASGILQGVLLPSRDLLIRAVTPPGSMGKVMGLMTTGMMLSGAITQPLFGWIMDIGEARWVFWLGALFVAGALLGYSRARGTTADGPG